MARTYASSMEYWTEREREHIQQREQDDEKTLERLKDKYREAEEEIQKEIEAFYGRYSSREGISMTEARKRVSKLDIERYAKKAERYVKERNFTDRANEELRLYNVTMKINRLELLKKNIELELLGLYSEEERNFEEEITRTVREEYARQAGILADTVEYSHENIERIVNSSFLTAHWSDRLWQHQEALRAELDKLLNRGIVQGINPRALARDLRDEINTSIFNSERLLITEFARVQKDVFIDSMRQNGFTQYQYLAQASACPICKALDEKIFNVDDAEVGVNIHPMHPFCRCSASGYASREEMERSFRERGLMDGPAESGDGDAPAIRPSPDYKKLSDAYESVRLGSIDKAYQEEIKERLLDLQNVYPIGEKWIRVTNSTSQRAFGFNKAGIVTRWRKDEPYGQFIHQINFSNKLMKDKRSSARTHDRTYKARGSKLAEIDTGGLATVDHEYAHAIDNWYVFAKNPELLETAKKYRDLVKLDQPTIDDANAFNDKFLNKSKHMSDVIADRMKKEYNLDDAAFQRRVKEEFGTYATKNNKEFLAEGFSLARFDKDPSEFTQKFMQFFDQEYTEILKAEE